MLFFSAFQALMGGLRSATVVRESLTARIQQNDQEREALWTNTRRVDDAHPVEREGTTQ
jgi:hypothetical protein